MDCRSTTESGAGSEGLKSHDWEILSGKGKGKGLGPCLGMKRLDSAMSQEKGKGKGRGRAVTGLKASDREVSQAQREGHGRTLAASRGRSDPVYSRLCISGPFLITGLLAVSALHRPPARLP